MIESINDYIRSELASKKNESEAAIYLDQFNNKEEIIKLLFSDHFKMLFFIAATTKNKKLLSELSNINIDAFLLEFDNPTVIKNVLHSSKIFNSLSYISKIGLYNLLEIYNQDKILMKISKFHALDKITYNFNYDLDSFKDYYIDYRKSYKSFEDLGISIYISSKLDELKETDYNKYKHLLSEMIKEYYKWNYFILHNFKDNLTNDDIVCINFIENQPLDYIINYIKDNFNFLVKIIEGYLFYSSGCDKISKPIVDEYFNVNAPEKVLKKLYYDKK